MQRIRIREDVQSSSVLMGNRSWGWNPLSFAMDAVLQTERDLLLIEIIFFVYPCLPCYSQPYERGDSVHVFYLMIIFARFYVSDIVFGRDVKYQSYFCSFQWMAENGIIWPCWWSEPELVLDLIRSSFLKIEITQQKHVWIMHDDDDDDDDDDDNDEKSTDNSVLPHHIYLQTWNF